MTDHDAIAARVRLMSEVCECDTDYCRHAEAHDDAPDYDGISAAYLDLYDEVKRLRSERDALRAHPYLPAEEIAAIERGNRRWHGEYDTTVSVRWEPYKPDGQRQMKAKGRWQTMTFNSSDYFRWENCNRPAQVRQALKGDSDE